MYSGKKKKQKTKNIWPKLFNNQIQPIVEHSNRKSMTGTSQTCPKKPSTHRNEKSHFRSMADQFDNHQSDSGFKSNYYQDKRKSSEKLNTHKVEVPHMLSFVGGAFTVQLYKNAVCDPFSFD